MSEPYTVSSSSDLPKANTGGQTRSEDLPTVNTTDLAANIATEIAELQQKADELSWNKQYWGPDGAIALRERWFKIASRDDVSGAVRLSALSSTYYSAAGNAFAHFRLDQFLQKPIWLWRAIVCGRKARSLSDKLVSTVGGIEHLSADQLDIRSSILRKTARIFRRNRDLRASIKCVDEALTRPDIEPGTRLLLLINRAECYRSLQVSLQVLSAYSQMEQLVAKHASDKAIPANKLIRFYRAAIVHYRQDGQISKVENYEYDAKVLLADNPGLEDQALKLQAATAA